MPALDAVPAAPYDSRTGTLAQLTDDDRHRLVLAHLGLAEAVAHRFSGASTDWLDLRQVAYLALVNASHRFDPAAGHEFAAYASPTISGAVKRSLRDHAWMVRPPRAVQELHSTVTVIRPSLMQSLGHEPSARDLAGATGRSAADVHEAVAASNAFHPFSLDADVGAEQPVPLHETIASIEAGFARAEARATIARASRGLPLRDRRVLVLRYGLDYTQAEIGLELGISQMHVSRILRRAISRLRASGGADSSDGYEPAAVPEATPGS